MKYVYSFPKCIQKSGHKKKNKTKAIRKYMQINISVT